MLLDLTELSSYLALVSSFEFGNVSGDGGPRPRTAMNDVGRDPPVRGPSTRRFYDTCFSYVREWEV